MQPLFTVHAGEYLVGAHLERCWGEEVAIWLPSKDLGIDLLLTRRSTGVGGQRFVSLQVKYSKDYVADGTVSRLPDGSVSGWWKFAPSELENSSADFWVLVIVPPDKGGTRYIVIRPDELLDRLRRLRDNAQRLDFYLAASGDHCFETRGLSAARRSQVFGDPEQYEDRDFSRFLDGWSPIRQQLDLPELR